LNHVKNSLQAQALAEEVVKHEEQLYSGKSDLRWYESLLDLSSADEAESCKNAVGSRGVWSVLLYRLLDVTTWLKCEMPLPLGVKRGNVPQFDIPASFYNMFYRHDVDIFVGLDGVF
jgi:hypothetical protein